MTKKAHNPGTLQNTVGVEMKPWPCHRLVPVKHSHAQVMYCSFPSCANALEYGVVYYESTGGHGSRSRYCQQCVGILMSHYSSFEVPDPTPEVLMWKRFHDMEYIDHMLKKTMPYPLDEEVYG